MQMKCAIISYLKIKEYLCNISCNDLKGGHIEHINHGIADAQLTDLLSLFCIKSICTLQATIFLKQ